MKHIKKNYRSTVFSLLFMGLILGVIPADAYRMIQNTSTGRQTAGARVTCNDSGGFVHWTTANIPWRLNPAGQGSGKAASLQAAMTAWNNVTNANHNLTYAGTTSAGWSTDGINTVLWANGNGCTGSCLALTALVLQKGQTLVESDITFNASYTWNTNGADRDTQAVAAHEFGHALGIHHTEITSTPRPTMYASYFGSGGRTLEPDDAAALQCAQSKYPVGSSATVSITATDPSAAEPNNTGRFRISRTGSTASSLTVTLTRGGTATNGSDYSSISTIHTIAAGQSFKNITVSPINDSLVEGTETVVLGIAPRSHYSVGSPSSATVTIADDDQNLPRITINAIDSNAAENPLNTGRFRITRTGSTASSLTVTLTRSGTATNGSDYSSISTTQTILAGQTSRTITVTPINDSIMEGSETVVLRVASRSHYTVGSPSVATVTIADDDQMRVTITATDSVASESSGNTGQFRITRTGSTASALTVNLSRGGTATNGSDYTSISTTQTILAGQSSKNITLSPVNDGVNEALESVVLSVAAGSGYTVGSPSSATVNITDNDYVPCSPSSTRLCLGSGRFEVTLAAINNGTPYTGRTFSNNYSNDAGGFWLFHSGVIEVMVKILDGAHVNDRFWVYHGSATGASYTMTVKDRANNITRTYSSGANTFCGGADTFPGFIKSAEEAESEVLFPELGFELGAEPVLDTPNFTCSPNSTTLCLLNNRFQVRVRRGSTYQRAVGWTGQSGIFWFFAANNAEVFLNIHDGTGFNGKYWVFFGSLTDQGYQVEVVDSVTGQAKTYTPGAAHCGVADIDAF